MVDRFSSDTADHLIDTLTQAHSLIAERTDRLLHLSIGLADSFRDVGYVTFAAEMQKTLQSSAALNDTLLQIIVQLSAYRDEMVALEKDGWRGEADRREQSRETLPGYDTERKSAAEERSRKKLQQEVGKVLRNDAIPACAKRAYERWGSKCAVSSSEYLGTAFYSPSKGYVKFNLKEDLNNPCGKLSTFFHEIGHMIDHSVTAGRCLSDDASFFKALRQDWTNCLTSAQDKYGCNTDEAMRRIRMDLMSDNNLYADVSDIIGALTNCKCQNLWGHDQNYWLANPSRVQKEAFANMYSVIMGDATRAAVMDRYFPIAFKRFRTILEGCL